MLANLNVHALRVVLPGLVVLALLTGCNPGTAPAPSHPPGGGSTATLGTVGAGGGQLGSASGTIELVVPSGALGGNVTITSGSPLQPPKGGLPPETTLGPDGTTFKRDATLTFTYDPSSLPNGTNQADLALVREVGGAWLMLPTTIDTSKHTLSAPIGGLGTYAVADTLHTFVGPHIEQVRLLQAGAEVEGGTDSLPGYSQADPAQPFQNGVAGACSNLLQGVAEFPAAATGHLHAAGMAGTVQTPTGVVEQSQASNSVDLNMSASRLDFSQGATSQTNPLKVQQWASASAGDDYRSYPLTGYFFTVADPGGGAIDLSASWTAAGNNGLNAADSGSEVTVDVYEDDGGSCTVTQGSGLLFKSQGASWNQKGSHVFHFPSLTSVADRFLYVYVWIGAYAKANSTVASSSGPDGSQAATSVTVTLSNLSMAWTGY